MAGLCEGGNEPPGSLKAGKTPVVAVDGAVVEPSTAGSTTFPRTVLRHLVALLLALLAVGLLLLGFQAARKVHLARVGVGRDKGGLGGRERGEGSSDVSLSLCFAVSCAVACSPCLLASLCRAPNCFACRAASQSIFQLVVVVVAVARASFSLNAPPDSAAAAAKVVCCDPPVQGCPWSADQAGSAVVQCQVPGIELRAKTYRKSLSSYNNFNRNGGPQLSKAWTPDLNRLKPSAGPTPSTEEQNLAQPADPRLATANNTRAPAIGAELIP
ncbi:hypothetical protein ANN_21551 [Periplaneta americana]|uniref:Uncharacterized protein n=1 Tax=Periplaneta americana TaxID=6978 RepID=A0ABQ8S687_PERAM|nr:hypothetical protein ANN_21551 [Periplaneta americana]